jgi:hypothetical protein
MPSRRKLKSTRTATAWRSAHKSRNVTTGDFWADQAEISRSRIGTDRFRVAIVAMLLSLGVQLNGNHNSVHASLKSSRGPRDMSFAGSP